MSNQSGATTAVLSGACTDDADRFAIELEVDLGVWKESGLFPNLDRDSDLTS